MSPIRDIQWLESFPSRCNSRRVLAPQCIEAPAMPEQSVTKLEIITREVRLEELFLREGAAFSRT